LKNNVPITVQALIFKQNAIEYTNFFCYNEYRHM
jgi:hypothetical protein